MVAVRDRFMAAIRTVNVIDIMSIAYMATIALRRVDFRYRKCVLFDDSFLDRMVKMPVMQIINMTIMFQCHMATLFSMRMFVVIINLCRHRTSPFRLRIRYPKSLLS